MKMYSFVLFSVEIGVSSEYCGEHICVRSVLTISFISGHGNHSVTGLHSASLLYFTLLCYKKPPGLSLTELSYWAIRIVYSIKNALWKNTCVSV